MKCEMYADKGESIGLQYYEIKNDRPPLVLLHAQAVDSTSFFGVMPALARRFHVYAVDCYGHGGSLQDAAKYNVADCGEAIVRFLQDVVKAPACLLGHSSGGLIAAYVASSGSFRGSLVLEDPPFFSCQGEARKRTFNYADLSTVCHAFLSQEEERDFVLYYFTHQRLWQLFPESAREKLRPKLIAAAARYRHRHPERNLWVPFWPKAGLAAYQGMNAYDPRFGEAFYTDRFHAGIAHEDLLRGIRCPTLFLKARTEIGQDGLLLAALSEEDLRRVLALVPDCSLVRFDCGHAIHIEEPKAFVSALLTMA